MSWYSTINCTFLYRERWETKISFLSTFHTFSISSACWYRIGDLQVLAIFIWKIIINKLMAFLYYCSYLHGTRFEEKGFKFSHKELGQLSPVCWLYPNHFILIMENGFNNSRLFIFVLCFRLLNERSSRFLVYRKLTDRIFSVEIYILRFYIFFDFNKVAHWKTSSPCWHGLIISNDNVTALK